MRHERRRTDGRSCPTLKKHGILPHPKHSRLKNHFFSSRNPMYVLAATINTKSDISGVPSMQPTEQICTSPPGSAGSEHMPPHPSCVRLPESSVSRANATGVLKVLKKLVEVALVGSKIRLASWLGCVIYFILINC